MSDNISKYRKQIYFVTLFFLLFVIAVTRMPESQKDSALIRSPRQGFYPPHTSGELMTGEYFDETSLAGKAVVLNFWASWCPPCKAEMPTLEAASLEYAVQDVVILGVNATSQDSLADARDFINSNNITFPIVLDTSGQINADFAVNSLPTTFFIGKDGKIKNVIVGGPISATSLRVQIEALLGDE